MWACWPDTFSLGRWSLSLQPPEGPLPLQLSPSRPSRTCVRVGSPFTGSGWPASPWLAADRRIPGQRGGGAGLRGRPVRASTNLNEGQVGGIKTRYKIIQQLTKSTEISILILYSRPVRPVHSTCFTPRQVSTLLRTLPRRNLPLRSSATLHVVGPDAGVAPVCFLGRPSQVRQPPMASESPWSEAPARRPVLLET